MRRASTGKRCKRSSVVWLMSRDTLAIRAILRAEDEEDDDEEEVDS